MGVQLRDQFLSSAKFSGVWIWVFSSELSLNSPRPSQCTGRLQLAEQGQRTLNFPHRVTTAGIVECCLAVLTHRDS